MACHSEALNLAHEILTAARTEPVMRVHPSTWTHLNELDDDVRRGPAVADEAIWNRLWELLADLGNDEMVGASFDAALRRAAPAVAQHFRTPRMFYPVDFPGTVSAEDTFSSPHTPSHPLDL